MRQIYGDAFYEWDGSGHWRLDGQFAKTEEVEPADVPDLLRGRTIAQVTMEGESESGQGNDLMLRLDDGTVLVVSGWGHDWWGTSVFQVSTTSVCEDSLDRYNGLPCTTLSPSSASG